MVVAASASKSEAAEASTFRPLYQSVSDVFLLAIKFSNLPPFLSFLLKRVFLRRPGAPILTVTLHADDATITCRNWDIGFSVKTKVAYEGVLGAETAGPIMFHAGALTGYEADLVLEHQEGETWEQVPLGFFCGGGMYLDDLPPGYRSARRESFVCLRAGRELDRHP
jgi:hypothetical protein